jgi:hypothetical protein
MLTVLQYVWALFRIFKKIPTKNNYDYNRTLWRRANLKKKVKENGTVQCVHRRSSLLTGSGRRGGSGDEANHTTARKPGAL